MNKRKISTQQKNLILLSIAKLLSGFASYIFDIGIVIYLYDKTESAAAISGFFISQLLPAFLIFLSGKVIDGYNKKNLMAACNLFKALLFLLLLANKSLWCIYMVTFFMNLILEFEGNTLNAIMPDMFAKKDILKAASVINVLDSAAMIAAPLFASFLAMYFPIGANLFIDVLIYIGAVLVYLFLKFESTSNNAMHTMRTFDCHKPKNRSLLKSQTIFTELIKNKSMLYTLTFWGVFMFCIGFAAPLEVIMIETELNMPSLYYGIGNTMEGIGMLAASVFLLSLIQKLTSASIIGIGLFSAACSYLTIGLSKNIETYLIGACLVGITATLCPLGFKTSMQIKGNPNTMGQIFTTSRFFILLLRILGSTTVGILLHVWDIRLMYYLISGILFLIAILYLWQGRETAH